MANPERLATSWRTVLDPRYGILFRVLQALMSVRVCACAGVFALQVTVGMETAAACAPPFQLRRTFFGSSAQGCSAHASAPTFGLRQIHMSMASLRLPARHMGESSILGRIGFPSAG